MDLNFILQNTVGHLYWKDDKGRYLGANQAFISLAGLKHPDDIIGKTDKELFSSVMSHEKLIILEETDRRIIKSGVGESLKEEGIDTNGKPAYYMTRKIPLRNDKGEITGIMGTSLDISKEMQADIARTEFLANMRHDIRTTLSGIVGFSELLKSESSEPRIKEYADNLIASSHALLDLMDEVLEAVRVSSGEIPLLKRKFNLQHTLKQVVALYQARAHEKKLDLTLTFEPAVPHFVIGDKIRLHRIALELIGNALNFTDIGHVHVHVILSKKENRELIIKLTITDSGMGIPKEKQNEIYLQFKRLTPSYQGIYKGAGLGLYIVKQFMDELGGEIYVESEPRKGTVFTCLIPLQASLLDDSSGCELHDESPMDKSYIVPIKNQMTSSTPQNNKKTKNQSKILVVEDNFIAQTVAKILLSGMNCYVDVATSGMEALTLLGKNDYDLIFMDIGLGEGMDGYEVTHHIRSKDVTKHIPIIALTAHSGDESKERCIGAGMDAVLTKPLTSAHAIDILKSFIPERHEMPSVESSMARVGLPGSDEEMFQLNQFPILNTNEALKNCATQEMLTELLTMMTQELPEDLNKMKKAFKELDYPLVEKIAHKIKGGAVYLGTTRMKYACQYVERYWKTGQRELFDTLYHQAVATIEETIIYIQGWLQKNRP